MEKKKKRIIVWSAVGSFLIALFLAVTLAGLVFMPDLLGSVLGKDKAVFVQGIEPLYEADYNSKEAVYKDANELNVKVCEEGFVLLKNDLVDGQPALPLKSSDGVSIFGKNSVNLAYGGSGSSGGDSSSAIDLYEGLRQAGFKTNDKLKSFYEDKGRSGKGRSENSSDLDNGDSVFYSTGETPMDKYTGEVSLSEANYKGYTDAALIVFSRIGGEGFDLPRSMKGVEGARKDDDHYLQLDKNETDLLQSVCSSNLFKKVVVIINSGAAMELGFLENPAYYAYQEKIDAAIWMGFPGAQGSLALGRILNGKVNPSGRTVDTYSLDYKKDPTWVNFGDYLKYGSVSGDAYLGTGNEKYYFVDYEENIYSGYRYYETRGAGDEQWYQDNVVYPFGYGKSYTTFSWEIESDSEIRGKDISDFDGDDLYTIKVKVTNTGEVAGKDVVQLYGHAPYEAGEIEKPEVVLLDFAKTKELKKGESDVVELQFNPYYLASYDYKDANLNGDSCYELDASDDYKLYVSHNAHEKEFDIPFTLSDDVVLYEDPSTGYSVENRYTDLGVLSSDYHLQELLSREDWTMPTSPTDEQRTISPELLEAIKDTSHNNPEADGYYDEEMPTFGSPAIYVLRDLLNYDENNKPMKLSDGNFVSFNNKNWDTIINQLTVSELKDLCNLAAFKTNALTAIGKPMTNDTDGPTGFTNFMDTSGTYWKTCYYCAPVVMSSTWNQDLIEDLGVMVGNEGLVGADGKGNNLPYSGWYAPGVNIHRSPFGGRNFEYFSEDAILTGKIAAAEIRGCRSKGVYCYVKHFALNEQETHRSSNGSGTWVTEQAMREIYLKPFELAVKEGGATAIMSSFNRIGAKWTGGDYRLLTEILRNEWGFKGMVITDFNTTTYGNLKQMAYAGGDLNLGNDMTLSSAINPDWCNPNDVADLIVLRKCVKNILYTVVNSNALNGEVDHYNPAWWKIAIIAADAAVVAGIAVWGFFVFCKRKEKVS